MASTIRELSGQDFVSIVDLYTQVRARTMQIVTEAALARKGITPDPAESQKQFDKIVAMFEAQADAFYTSGLVLDDGVIDPRDTRDVLAFCLDTVAEAASKELRPIQFGVARM